VQNLCARCRERPPIGGEAVENYTDVTLHLVAVVEWMHNIL
jgi:hypothetical protein